MHLSHKPTDGEILQFVEAWIDNLARGDYTGAFSRTEHDPYTTSGFPTSYGLSSRATDCQNHFAAAGCSLSRRESPHRAARHSTQLPVDREDIRPHALAEVWYNLSLNGEWSDLTATFRVEPRDGGSAVVLQEIHVF